VPQPAGSKKKPPSEDPAEEAAASQAEASAEPSASPAAAPVDVVDAGPPKAEEHGPLTAAAEEGTAGDESHPQSPAPATREEPPAAAPQPRDSGPSSLERPGWTDPRESSDWSPREPQPLTLEALQRGPALVPVAPSGGGAEPAIATPAPPTGAQVIAPDVESQSSARSWEAGSSYEIRPLPPVDGAPAPRISSRGAWPQEPIPIYPSTGR